MRQSGRNAWIGFAGALTAAIIGGLSMIWSHHDSAARHVQGFVHTPSGEPIASAHITIAPEPGLAIGKITDAYGKFQAEIPALAQTVHVFVNSEGFKAIDVEYPSNQAQINVLLSPLQSGQNPVPVTPSPHPKQPIAREQHSPIIQQSNGDSSPNIFGNGNRVTRGH